MQGTVHEDKHEQLLAPLWQSAVFEFQRLLKSVFQEVSEFFISCKNVMAENKSFCQASKLDISSFQVLDTDALFLAAFLGNSSEIVRLLQKGVPVNAKRLVSFFSMQFHIADVQQYLDMCILQVYRGDDCR